MDTVIIKVGGAPSRNAAALSNLADEIRALSGSERDRLRIAVVHGGGAEVSLLSEQLGIRPNFADGVRLTSEHEMGLVDMVLCGLVNKRLVRALARAGIGAVGLSGADAALLTGEPLLAGDGSATRTARVSAVNTGILTTLWASGYVPVIASPGTDSAGGAVNINADEATLALGSALSAETVIFISDIAGVLDNDGSVIRNLTPGRIDDISREGAVTGGMVEKLRSAAAALRKGARHIVIGEYDGPGALGRLMRGETGSAITGEVQ